MREILLPTKTAQDDIKLQTDKITDVKSKTDLIGTANPTTANTTTIMNYLKQLENKIANISGGTDWSKFSPLIYKARTYHKNNQSETWQPVYSVNGKGFISEALVQRIEASSNGYVGIRITIDGVVVFSTQEPSGKYFIMGVTTKENIRLGTPSNFSNSSLNAMSASFPNIDTSKQALIGFLPLSIFFSKSCVVEVFSYNITSDYTYNVSVEGGLG